MTIEHTEPRELPGVRAVAFYARTRDSGENPTKTVRADAEAWLDEHPGVCLLRVEYDQWDDSSELAGLPPAERVLATIFGTDDGRTTKWCASATVYYDDMVERPIPPPPVWSAA